MPESRIQALVGDEGFPVFQVMEILPFQRCSLSCCSCMSTALCKQQPVRNHKMCPCQLSSLKVSCSKKDEHCKKTKLRGTELLNSEIPFQPAIDLKWSRFIAIITGCLLIQSDIHKWSHWLQQQLLLLAKKTKLMLKLNQRLPSDFPLPYSRQRVLFTAVACRFQLQFHRHVGLHTGCWCLVLIQVIGSLSKAEVLDWDPDMLV